MHYKSFNYDRMGNIAQQQETIGTSVYTMSYGHGLAEQLTSETYPSGRILSFGYDDGGRLSTLFDNQSNTFVNSFSYAPHGGVTSETFGNGAVHSLTYNNALQPNQVKLTIGGAEQQRFDYFYGQMNPSDGSVNQSQNTGQVGRIDGYISGSKQWDQRFTYDSIGRLSQAAEYQGGSTLTWQAHYDYDRFGNRYQYEYNSNVAYTPVQPSDIDTTRNRFITTGSTPTSYDAAGNITVDTKFRAMSYVYDANNRQTSATRTDGNDQETAVYDGAGQRVQTTATGTTRQMIYDAFGQDIADYTGGALERENIYRGGQLLATYEVAGTCYKTISQFVSDFLWRAWHSAFRSDHAVDQHVDSGTGARGVTATEPGAGSR